MNYVAWRVCGSDFSFLLLKKNWISLSLFYRSRRSFDPCCRRKRLVGMQVMKDIDPSHYQHLPLFLHQVLHIIVYFLSMNISKSLCTLLFPVAWISILVQGLQCFVQEVLFFGFFMKHHGQTSSSVCRLIIVFPSYLSWRDLFLNLIPLMRNQLWW